MGVVVAHKPHNATIGVIDKNVQTHEDLQAVTYKDIFGTLHTVFAHINGPFSTPDDIVKAAEDGILHTFETNKAAAEHWALHAGNEEFVARLKELDGGDKSQPDSEGRDN
jgi:hypothetical protein